MGTAIDTEVYDMTDRETEILHIIEKDPTISQNQIADMLGITRSSVSVYINNMTKKGILRGRGYIIARERYPLVVGAVNMDIIATPQPQDLAGPLCAGRIFEDSRVAVRYGGCAKNVSELLVRLGCAPRMIAAIAGDIFGRSILQECRDQGIVTDSALVLEGASTSLIVEVQDPGGQQVLTGLRSRNIAQQITPGFLRQQAPVLSQAAQIVIEDKLSAETLSYLTAAWGDRPLFLHATSYSRTGVYIGLLDRFHTVLIPPEIACIAAGAERTDGSDLGTVRELARQLMQMGARRAVLPLPDGTLCLADGAGYTVYAPAVGRTAGYTFYRDAVMAGLVYSCDRDLDERETLRFLAACREAALQSGGGESFCLPLVKQQLEKGGGRFFQTAWA